MTKKDGKLVPPDGGYGWVVTFAYALNNVFVLPLIAGFGLVFKEAFEETNLTATQGTLIITLNHGIGMLLSFFGGPLLRRFGYRKVAVAGALCIATGLILTAFASSFWLFIMSYSIINSMGIAAVMAAFTLAINSFFKDKRGRAIGVGMSITGLGAIFTPLLMSALMDAYGWRGAVLVLGALCLHSLVGACLLRPAKWYMKPEEVCEEMVPLNKNGTAVDASNEDKQNDSLDSGPIMKDQNPSTKSLASAGSIQARHNAQDAREPISEVGTYKWWESQEINLGSSINIFNEDGKRGDAKNAGDFMKSDAKNGSVHLDKVDGEKTFGQKIVDFFDLTLLTDPVFVNILIGLSIASCVETNFSLLFPIMLKDLIQLQTDEIARVMAVIGFSDTCFRLVAPFIGEWFKRPPRFMYIVGLLMIITTRTLMLFATTFYSMLFVAFGIGITKGLRTVYMNIVIPSYVPIERLPFASGIQMLVNGVIIISMGSALGRIRQVSGSYYIPIIVLNVVTMVTVLMWTSEYLYFKIRGKPVPLTMKAMEA